MKILNLTLAGLLFLSLNAYAKAIPLKALAVLHNSEGKKVGRAKLSETPEGAQIFLKVSNFKPGPHGFHIHEVGKCEPPDFKSAGGHFNPNKKQHGHKNPQGAHAGDLPNLIVETNGKGKAEFFAKGVALNLSEMSLVIHANADDEKTDPSGNSGARIACGVIQR